MKRARICAAIVLPSLLVVDVGAAMAAEPTGVECVAANEASYKLTDEKKLRAARSQLLVCHAASCPAEVRKDCEDRFDALNAQIPAVIFGAQDPSGADLGAVRVTMDGSEVLTERLDGTPLAVDPGEHTFTFETAGQGTVTKTFIIRQGEKERHEAITLGPAMYPPTAPPPEPPPRPVYTARRPWTPPSAEPRYTSRPPPTSTAQRTAGVWIFWGGVAGLGVGGIAGLLAKQQFNTAQTETGSQQYNDSASAVTTGNVATGIVIGGSVLATVGWIVWLTAPSNAQATLVVSRDGLLLRGAF